jgi:branched-chain amino acid transport system substrate-binding protein
MPRPAALSPRTWLLAVFIAMLAPLLVVGPAATARAQGVTGDTIVLGTTTPMSGPASFFKDITMSAQAYFAYVNEQGGVHGRKIKLLVRDDGYQPAQTIGLVRELAEKEQVFAFVAPIGVNPVLAISDYVTEQKIPVLAAAAGGSQLSDPLRRYIFPALLRYDFCGKYMADFAAQRLGAKRIAVFYQNDAVGQDLLKGALPELKKRGLAFAAEASYQAKETDVSAQVLALKKAEPEVVLMFSISGQTANFLKTAYQLGWKPKFVLAPFNTDPVTIKLAGSPEAAEGVYSMLNTPLPDSNSPKVVQYRELMKKYAPDVRIGTLSINGMAEAQIVVESLRRAGRDLTRERLLAATETLRDWDGSVFGWVRFTPTSHLGTVSAGMAIAKGGQWVELEPVKIISGLPD